MQKCLKDSSAKNYQNNKEKERLQFVIKKTRDRYQSLSKEEKEKSATIWS